MALCHLKHAELAEFLQVYKGRIVFRGDDVKDQEGTHAVFTEQGTSASHLAAAKFLDAIARLPGNDGHDMDAISAYTQVKLSDAAAILGREVVPDTWISLPHSRRP